MKAKKTEWAKSVRCKMIELDLTVNTLAVQIGLSREYVSAVLNDRVRSNSARKLISDFLDVPYISY